MTTTIPESRLALIHRVIMPDEDYPKEYAILVTDTRSIFIRQEKRRRSFVLSYEMKIGTALVTDVPAKTLEDYEKTSLETLSAEGVNLTIPHGSVVSFAMRADKLERRKWDLRDSFVWMVMRRQKEIFQVYNFEMKYRQRLEGESGITFYAVPLGVYFKPRRQVQTRETILREYAMDVLETYRRVLPASIISSQRP